MTTVIDALGVSWKLAVSDGTSPTTFFYNHPNFGYLAYEKQTWNCSNVNTMTLVSQGSLPDGKLPKKICVRPFYDCPDITEYPTPEEKCQCKDPECPFEWFLWLTCDSCTESCTVTFEKDVRAGVDCPENPSYTATCTLCSQTLSVTIYCCDGAWAADIVVNGTHCDTVGLTVATICPLTFIPAETTACSPYFVDCASTCVGLGAPCTETGPCCPCLDGDGKLFDVVFDCTACSETCVGMNTAGVDGQCQMVMDGCTPSCDILGEIACGGAGWSISITDSGGGCTFLTGDPGNTVTVNSCDPVDVTFTSPDGTITITEQ